MEAHLNEQSAKLDSETASHGEGWEPREDVLASASISASRLWRLAEAGLIGEPIVRPRASGPGKISRYPPGTTAKVVRALEAGKVERRLPERAWLIWWEDGGLMSAATRDFLLGVGTYLDEGLSAIRKLFTDSRAGDQRAIAQLDEVYREAEQGRLVGPFAQARGRTGKAFGSTLARVAMEIASGEFTNFAHDEVELSSQSEAALVERAFAVDRARRESLPGSEPWFSGELESDLAGVASRMADITFATIAAREDAELDLARIEIQGLMTAVGGAAEVADTLFGRGKFGFRAIANAVAARDYQSQAFLLLAWAKMREDSDLVAKMAEWSEIAKEITTVQQATATLAALAEAIPAYRDLLAPERLGAALTDPGARAAYEAELAGVREAHADQVAEVLSAIALEQDPSRRRSNGQHG